MRAKEIFLLTLVLSGSLFFNTGCTGSECKEARLQADKSRETFSALEIEQKNLVRKLWNEYLDDCATGSFEAIDDVYYCPDGEEMSRPIDKFMDNREVAQLSSEISAAKRRWAITVTSYKDCFEPSQVITGEEILRG